MTCLPRTLNTRRKVINFIISFLKITNNSRILWCFVWYEKPLFIQQITIHLICTVFSVLSWKSYFKCVVLCFHETLITSMPMSSNTFGQLQDNYLQHMWFSNRKIDYIYRKKLWSILWFVVIMKYMTCFSILLLSRWNK